MVSPMLICLCGEDPLYYQNGLAAFSQCLAVLLGVLAFSCCDAFKSLVNSIAHVFKTLVCYILSKFVRSSVCFLKVSNRMFRVNTCIVFS